MAISDKDVLAARKLVMTGLILHVMAFVAEGFTLSRLSRFPAQCLAELHHPTISSSKGLMWSYFVLRVLSTFSPIPTVRRLMNRLNEIEHAPRQGLQVKEARSWESLPATLFTNYLCFGALAFIQLIPTLSITRASFPQSAEKLRTEWGQSAALIVASVAIAHVGFSYFSLFRSDAMKHRLAVCEAMRTSVIWALPQRSWKTSTVWNVLQQRSPFSKVLLRPSDELLVDDTQLQPYAELNLSREEQDGLWKELELAFIENDRVYIMDCLNRGAPNNRLDEETQEYPIHMAARFGNLDIISRIHPPGPHNTLTATDQFYIEMRDFLRTFSSSFDRLLSLNADKETPLTLAVNANQKPAVRWILDRLREIPRTSTQLFERAEQDIARVLESAIQNEKTDIITIIMDTWPNWQSVKLQIDRRYYGAVNFALLSAKSRSAELIISRWTQTYAHPVRLDSPLFYTSLQALPRATSKKWSEFFRDGFPNADSEMEFLMPGIRGGHVELLLDLGYDSRLLCKAALFACLKGFKGALTAMYPRNASYSLPPEVLDCMCTFDIHATKEARERCFAAGGRDWWSFWITLMNAKTDSARDLLIEESLSDNATRMTNAIFFGSTHENMPEAWEFDVHRALAITAFNMSLKSSRQVNDTIDLLIENGASVLESSELACSVLEDILNPHPHGTRTELYHTLDESTFSILLKQAAIEKLQYSTGTRNALHTACASTVNPRHLVCDWCCKLCLWGIETLLSLGCSPLAHDSEGRLPKHLLKDFVVPPNVPDYDKVNLEVVVQQIRGFEATLSLWEQYYEAPNRLKMPERTVEYPCIESEIKGLSFGELDKKSTMSAYLQARDT